MFVVPFRCRGGEPSGKTASSIPKLRPDEATREALKQYLRARKTADSRQHADRTFFLLVLLLLLLLYKMVR